MNEFIAFNCRKLKRKELIHSCFNRNRVLNIKMTDKSQPVKIFHMESLINLFLDFDFRLEKCTWMHLRILMPLYILCTLHRYMQINLVPYMFIILISILLSFTSYFLNRISQFSYFSFGGAFFTITRTRFFISTRSVIIIVTVDSCKRVVHIVNNAG